MDFFSWFYYGGILTLVMAVPFGFCMLYLFIALRQWVIAGKENNVEKRMSAIQAFSIALTGMVLVAVIYYYLLWG
jgi:hypothetical protein